MSTPQTEASPARRFTQAYRRQFSRLPAGVQLVFLQLWLPVFFIVMFSFCYLASFSSPEIHDAPVGVVGSQQVGTELQQKADGVLEVTSYDSVAEGREALRSGDVIGVVDETAATPHIYVASAHQFQAATIAEKTLKGFYGADAEVSDVAPLPDNDSFGMVAMYLMLTWCIGGYMVAMFIGMMGAPLLHRTRIGIIAGGSVVVSLIANVLAGPVIGAVDGHFWALLGIGAAWIFAIGMAVNGLSYFFGRFITAPAILIFVFLSMPASGAAYPTWMLPGIFGFLQEYVVGFGMTEMIKHTLYGVGEAWSHAWIELLGYLVVGVVLTLIGKPWRERREAKRIMAGRTSMMADAQNANREHHIAIHRRVLEQHGVPSQKAAVAVKEDEDDTTTGYVAGGRSLTDD
jgi:hypothetical protein